MSSEEQVVYQFEIITIIKYMLKAFCYRIYPTNVQQQILRMQLGAVRFVYNYFLAEQQDRYEKKESHLSFFDLCRELVKLKRSDDYAWLYQTNAQSLYQGLKNLDSAYQNFFQKRAGHPRFKSRRNGHQSMAYPQGSYLDGNHIRIPKLGRVKIRLSRSFQGRVKTVTLKKTPTYKYFVSILVDDKKPLPDPIQEMNHVSGVDLGLNHIATVASATETTKYENPRFYAHHLPKLKHAQRSLSRKEKGSHRYRQQRKQVARMHEQVTHARQDYLHKLSTKLVSENQAVIVEDLNVRGLIKNRRLAKHIADVAWGEFVRQLEYKCRWAGKHLVPVDRFYPSSKTCAECSTKNEELTLKERVWTCADCGVALDRDANAAQNIRVAGMHKMSEAGYVFVNRGGDIRLGAWSFLALLYSVQQSSMKRVGRTTRSSSEMAQFSN